MRTFATLLCFALTIVCRPAFSDDTSLGIDEKLKAVYDLYRTSNVVTLKQHEFDIGLSFGYALNETRVLDLQDTARTLSAVTSVGYGITNGIQLSVMVPFLYQTHLAQDTTTTHLDTRASGLGDVTVGIAATLPTKTVSTTMLVSAMLPTADDDLGSKGVVTSAGFNVDKVMQPAFVYGGISWVRDWDAKKDSVGYNAGVGFFLNYALSIGAGLEGGFAFNPALGAAHDTMALVGKVSYQVTPSFGFTPSISLGLTEKSPDVALGLAMVWRF